MGVVAPCPNGAARSLRSRTRTSRAGKGNPSRDVSERAAPHSTIVLAATIFFNHSCARRFFGSALFRVGSHDHLLRQLLEMCRSPSPSPTEKEIVNFLTQHHKRLKIWMPGAKNRRQALVPHPRPVPTVPIRKRVSISLPAVESRQHPALVVVFQHYVRGMCWARRGPRVAGLLN